LQADRKILAYYSSQGDAGTSGTVFFSTAFKSIALVMFMAKQVKAWIWHTSSALAHSQLFSKPKVHPVYFLAADALMRFSSICAFEAGSFKPMAAQNSQIPYLSLVCEL